MIALVDYGIGNLRSVSKALSAVGAQVEQTDRPERILAASQVVLPGVGAFGDGMKGLGERGMDEVLLETARRGIPLLGICLGMQLLFEISEEMGEHVGLGLFPGRVRRFPVSDLKVPQTGWNQLWPEGNHPLLAGIRPGDYAYFNHSYYCDPASPRDSLARSEYGLMYTSAVGYENLFGVQFHPEKSQAVGLRILRNFVERCR